MNNDFAGRIFLATQGRLRKLTARGMHTDRIEWYCSGLEELELQTQPSDFDVLQVVGPTLTMLNIWDSFEEQSLTYSSGLLEHLRSFGLNIADIWIHINFRVLSEHDVS